MTDSRRDPETGGRPLADILREAGLDSTGRTGRRRRWDDTDDGGVRQRGTGGDRGSDVGRVGDRPSPGRRASDRTGDPELPKSSGERRRGVQEPSTAAIPGLRSSRKPGVPGVADAAAANGRSPSAGSTGRRAAGAGRGDGADDGGPSTGPIPVVRADEARSEEEAATRDGTLGWLRFGGELVVALGAGVGTYFLFTVLWELLPYLAAGLAPLAVTALVTGVGAWRQRQDREPFGVRVVAVLVFAGTLLTIVPAAGLLAAG